MIRDIKIDDLLNSEQLVREPVDKLANKIIESNSKKIILDGGRESGKSVVISDIERKQIGGREQTILTRFEPGISFAKEPNIMFDERYFKHYYELLLSRNLLNYIKSNYGYTYELYFKDIEEFLNKVSKERNEFVNKMYFGENRLKEYLIPQALTSEIINRIKKYLNIESLNIAVDRFDWTNGSSFYAQKVLSKYFDLFDKTIITSDDETIDKKRKKELVNNGYSFVSVDYGKKITIIREIIKKRLKYYNQFNTNYNINEELFINEVYKNIVKKAKGNIGIALDALSDFTDVFIFKDKQIDRVEEEFSKQIDYQINKRLQLKKINANKPRLHL